jgi:hypothetical protein
MATDKVLNLGDSIKNCRDRWTSYNFISTFTENKKKFAVLKNKTERSNIVHPHIQYDTAKQVCRMETENICKGVQYWLHWDWEEIWPV